MKFCKWIFLLVFIIWLAGYGMFVHKSASYTHDVPKCDYIAVLTGGKGRISLALDSIKSAKPKGIFVSGVYEKTTLNDILANEQSLGVYIILGKRARNTEENAAEICEWAGSSGVRSMVLITSDYHMIRSLSEIEYTDPALEIIPVTVPTQPSTRFLRKCFQEFHRMLLVYIKRYSKCC